MASEDVVGKTTSESAVSTIVNLAEEAKLAREGVKAPGHAILTICKSLVAGGVAGGVSRTAVAPLERLKILLQVQNPHNIKYNGTIQGLRYIWRTEGFRGLFKGNGTNCARIVPNSAVKFFSYEQASSKLATDEDQESMLMTNKNGQRFLCYLPMVEETKTGKPIAQKNMSSLIVESDRRIKPKTPDELMEVLTEQCLLRQEGWWSYEFCYKKHLRQFHVEDEKVVQEFILGVYDNEATAAFNENHSDISTLKDPRSKDAAQRYHAHQFTSGTICDLTNQPRETEVRFVCSKPRVMISSIKEISTCKYAITIHCPMLCKHPTFQEERPIWHTINCNEMPAEDRGSKADSFKDKQITMITDMENGDRFDSDQYAT